MTPEEKSLVRSAINDLLGVFYDVGAPEFAKGFAVKHRELLTLVTDTSKPRVMGFIDTTKNGVKTHE